MSNKDILNVVMICSVLIGAVVLFLGGLHLITVSFLIFFYGVILIGAFLRWNYGESTEGKDGLETSVGCAFLVVAFTCLAAFSVQSFFFQDGFLVFVPSLSFLIFYFAYRRTSQIGRTNFELKGINPKTKDGHRFSCHVRSWRPMWHIVCNNTPKLTAHDRFMGHMRNGYYIEGEQHEAIICTLKELLLMRSKEIEIEGKVADFGKMPDGRPIATLIRFSGTYEFSWEEMEAYLSFCESNDGYRMW